METPISPKVTAGGASGALVVLVLALLHAAGIDLAPEVSAALTTLIISGAAWITPDHLRSLGIRVAARDDEDADTGKHEDNRNGVVDDAGDHLQVIPAANATSDMKSDAAGI